MLNKIVNFILAPCEAIKINYKYLIEDLITINIIYIISILSIKYNIGNIIIGFLLDKLVNYLSMLGIIYENINTIVSNFIKIWLKIYNEYILNKINNNEIIKVYLKYLISFNCYGFNNYGFEYINLSNRSNNTIYNYINIKYTALREINNIYDNCRFLPDNKYSINLPQINWNKGLSLDRIWDIKVKTIKIIQNCNNIQECIDNILLGLNSEHFNKLPDEIKSLAYENIFNEKYYLNNKKIECIEKLSKLHMELIHLYCA